MTHTLVDITNIVSLMLGVIAFCLLFARTSVRKDEYPREVLMLMWALQGVIIAVLLTSLELILVEDDLAPLAHLIFLTVVILLVKINLLWVLWRTRTTLYRTGSRHTGGGLNADELDVDKDFADHPEEGS